MRRFRNLAVLTYLAGLGAFGGVAFCLSVAHAATETSPVVWTVQQATTAMLHPTALGPNASVIKGTRIVAVVTYGYAHNPSGAWDLNGNKTISGASGFWPITGAKCRGLGKAKAGHYGGFACDLQIDATRSSWPWIRTATFWIRPWSAATPNGSTVCLSDRALAACPPAPPPTPLPGDPRTPAAGSHEAACSSPSANPAGCMISKAELAAFKVLNVPHQVPILFGCVATSVFVYRCTTGGTTSTPLRSVNVKFAPSKTRWTTMTSAVVTSP